MNVNELRTKERRNVFMALVEMLLVSVIILLVGLNIVSSLFITLLRIYFWIQTVMLLLSVLITVIGFIKISDKTELVDKYKLPNKLKTEISGINIGISGILLVLMILGILEIPMDIIILFVISKWGITYVGHVILNLLITKTTKFADLMDFLIYNYKSSDRYELVQEYKSVRDAMSLVANVKDNKKEFIALAKYYKYEFLDW